MLLSVQKHLSNRPLTYNVHVWTEACKNERAECLELMQLLSSSSMRKDLAQTDKI